MNANAFTSYRALHYTWRKFQPIVHVSVGEREYKLKPMTLTGLRNAEWRAGWKAHVLSHLLPLGEGAFVDVGANVGQTLLDFLATSRSAPCYLFEPNPSCVVELNSFISINGLNTCKVIPVALSDRNGPATLYLAPSSLSDAGGSIVENLRPDRKFTEVVVPCFRLGDIYTDVGIESISMIKIDVEGAELLAITGMTGCIQRFRPIILCEVLDADPRADLDKHCNALKDLYEKIVSQSYSILSVIKKNDRSTVEKFVQIESFRNRLFSSQTAEECDYVFCPNEKLGTLSTSGIETERVQV